MIRLKKQWLFGLTLVCGIAKPAESPKKAIPAINAVLRCEIVNPGGKTTHDYILRGIIRLDDTKTIIRYVSHLIATFRDLEQVKASLNAHRIALEKSHTQVTDENLLHSFNNTLTAVNNRLDVIKIYSKLHSERHG